EVMDRHAAASASFAKHFIAESLSRLEFAHECSRRAAVARLAPSLGAQSGHFCAFRGELMNWRTKTVEQCLELAERKGLQRSLGAFQLTMLGIGGIIGTGIFVLTA